MYLNEERVCTAVGDDAGSVDDGGVAVVKRDEGRRCENLLRGFPFAWLHNLFLRCVVAVYRGGGKDGVDGVGGDDYRHHMVCGKLLERRCGKRAGVSTIRKTDLSE